MPSWMSLVMFNVSGIEMNRVCLCKESPPLVMNVCVGAAETLERVGKYSSSLF